ncbi:hypothetical protein CGLAMM_00740 [Acetobacteraceae bacterium EV16G]|uniref:KAP NTPase domain-containing protein n=1 Tax=Sorlinia euscelidii TaxID=3081148 RepID=A0ABU7U2W9_9PROT
MSYNLNDSPIEDKVDDRYGVAPFAEAIAIDILKVKDPAGTTIALNGTWGSGKSSAINLIRSALEGMDGADVNVTEFKVWWYRGEEALALAFFEQLDDALAIAYGFKSRKLIRKLGRSVLSVGPMIEGGLNLTGRVSLAKLTRLFRRPIESYIAARNSLEKVFCRLEKLLRKKNSRFLIILDDLDRLAPEELLAVFRLIKSVGRLPNVLYLLAMDRQLADRVVAEKYPSEGPHFLEKIVQVSFDMPPPAPIDLRNALFSSIAYDDRLQLKDSQKPRFGLVFRQIVAPLITTPRHVVRLQNALAMSLAALTGKIDSTDLIAMEAIRLYNPALYRVIRENKRELCGSSDIGGNGSDERYVAMLEKARVGDLELAKVALQLLFPKSTGIRYGHDRLNQWNSERRVCIESHFDTYLIMSLSEDVLPKEKIDELVERAGEYEFIKTEFRSASLRRRRSGGSFVPIYLEALSSNAEQIRKNDVASLVKTLFVIFDDIDFADDAQADILSIFDNFSQFCRLISSMTRKRFATEERTIVILEASKKASLGCLVKFVKWAHDDYEHDTGQLVEESEENLVAKDALPELRDLALSAIRSARDSGELVENKNLAFILHRWVEFAGDDPSETREWTNLLFDDRSAVSTLMRAFTGSGLSSTNKLNGLPEDQVTRSFKHVFVENMAKVLDLKRFRKAVTDIANDQSTDLKESDEAREFLELWDREKKFAFN